MARHRYLGLNLTDTIAALKQGYLVVAGGGCVWLDCNDHSSRMRLKHTKVSHRSIHALHARNMLVVESQSDRKSFVFDGFIPDWVKFKLAPEKTAGR